MGRPTSPWSDSRNYAIQLEAELKPVLRAEDFMAFDLDRIFSLLKEWPKNSPR